VKGRRPSR